MKAKYILTALLAMGFMAQSCQDELDIEKKGNLGSPETYYTTDAEVQAGLAMCYSVMNRWWGYQLYDILDNLSDDMYTGGGTSTDYNDKQLINAYCFSSDNPDIKGCYQNLYTIIYNANLILHYVPLNNTTITPVMKQCMSEAYFFRGLCYMYLGAMWGTAPIVTDIMAPSECTVPNAESQNAVYEQAISDFKAAISEGGLVTKKDKNAVEYRITTELAQAYLGKTQVFAGKWSEAASSLAAVISSNKYDLAANEDYENLLNNRSNGNPEIMFSRYCDPTSTNPQSDWNAPQGANCYYEEHVMRGWRNDLWDWNVSPAWPPSIIGLDGMMAGYGECNPRASLYNDMKAWEEKNGGDLSRLNQTMKTYEWVAGTGNVISAGRKLFGNEGYFFWKNRFLSEEILGCYGFGGWNVWLNSNFRYMRYSEVLLLAAEAYLQSGNVAAATAELNKVRERAHETALGSCTMDDIKNEKRFELCIEACRWIDIVRWGDAPALLANQGKSVPQFDGSKTDVGATHANGGFVKGKHELLPFPATEMLVNPNIVQNPGWGGAAE